MRENLGHTWIEIIAKIYVFSFYTISNIMIISKTISIKFIYKILHVTLYFYNRCEIVVKLAHTISFLK